MRTITQRELRNESAAILRDVQAGQSIIVTRNGTPGRRIEAGIGAQIRVQGRYRGSGANDAAH